jgi:hypothetical protein
MKSVGELLEEDKYLVEHIGMVGIANDNCRCFDCMQMPMSGSTETRKYLDKIMLERQAMIRIINETKARKLIVTNKAQQQTDAKNLENLNLQLNSIAVSILKLLYIDKSLTLELLIVKIAKYVILLRDASFDDDVQDS